MRRAGGLQPEEMLKRNQSVNSPALAYSSLWPLGSGNCGKLLLWREKLASPPLVFIKLVLYSIDDWLCQCQFIHPSRLMCLLYNREIVLLMYVKEERCCGWLFSVDKSFVVQIIGASLRTNSHVSLTEWQVPGGRHFILTRAVRERLMFNLPLDLWDTHDHTRNTSLNKQNGES